MGLFDFFKQKHKFPPKRTDTSEIYIAEQSPVIKKQQAILNDETKSLDKRNAAYLAIRDEEERRLNEAYDFNSIEGINSIPVPCEEVNGDSPTGRVEYYLRGRCFAKHRDNGNIALATACIKKAHELMFVSDMIWDYDSFISSITWLHSVGLHFEAKEEEEKVDRHFQMVGFYPRLTRKDFDSSDSYLSWKKNIESIEKERRRKRAIRHEYYWIQENLPNLCPKSLSGYSRMKNINSKNYQKIVEEARKLGKNL